MHTINRALAYYPLHLAIHHLGGSTYRVDPRTVALRHNDYRTASWLGDTQTWRWDAGPGYAAGDAIVVTTGRLGGVTSYAVVRVGDCLTVEDITGRGIAGWFAGWGITTAVAS